MQDDRLEDDWVPTEDTRALEEIERETREQEAKNKAVVLEMIGDLPEADAKPPPNMLFICKLNPVTTEEVLTMTGLGPGCIAVLHTLMVGSTYGFTCHCSACVRQHAANTASSQGWAA